MIERKWKKKIEIWILVAFDLYLVLLLYIYTYTRSNFIILGNSKVHKRSWEADNSANGLNKNTTVSKSFEKELRWQPCNESLSNFDSNHELAVVSLKTCDCFWKDILSWLVRTKKNITNGEMMMAHLLSCERVQFLGAFTLYSDTWL